MLFGDINYILIIWEDIINLTVIWGEYVISQYYFLVDTSFRGK